MVPNLPLAAIAQYRQLMDLAAYQRRLDAILRHDFRPCEYCGRPWKASHRHVSLTGPSYSIPAHRCAGCGARRDQAEG